MLIHRNLHKVAKQEIVEAVTFWSQAIAVFFKALPYALIGLMTGVVQHLAMMNNGRKVPVWKTITSIFISAILTAAYGYAVEGMMVKWLFFLSMGFVAILGEHAIVWLMVNSDKVLGDIWAAVLNRAGYQKKTKR